MTSALDWITRLVSLDTTSRGSNLELIDVVSQELQRHGLTPTLLANGDGTKGNLLVTIPADDGRIDGGIALSGHTDVVPVDGQDWDTDAFTAQIRDGRLFGRGTCDMKGFIGVILATLPDLIPGSAEGAGAHRAVPRRGGRLSGRGKYGPPTCPVGRPTDNVHRRRANRYAGDLRAQVDQLAGADRPWVRRPLLPDTAGCQRD